jgi:uncharacterized protein YegJ (DUF2314 family)
MFKPLQWKTLMVLVFLLLISCNPSAPTPAPISTFTDPDEEFAKAVRQAQDTLYIWRQEFLAPKDEYSLMSLKIRFGEEGRVEDMWTEPVQVLDTVYTVRMVEGVTVETGRHPDRLVDVKPQDIVDWMLLKKDGTLVGGYTLRLEYERMTPEQQQRYLEITGYKFE